MSKFFGHGHFKSACWAFVPFPPLKKLYLSWKRLVAYGRYRLDNFFTLGVPAQFTVLLALMAGVILLGTLGQALGLYSAANKDVPSIGHKFDEGFWDAVWWSTMHIFDPSYVSQDYGATAPVVVLALIISMLGLVLFGGVIALVTAAVERRFAELAKGNSPVREVGHLLILGWSDKIFSILDLFEDHHKDVTVVILSNLAIAEMQERMRTQRDAIRRVKPILRTGSPTNLAELERVAFRDAHSIIVLADESAPDGFEETDIRTIKTLMLLAQPAGATPRPKMVAELHRREHIEVARLASQHSISLICSNEVLSRMITQSSRQPGLAQVYGQLFGFAGNEIYIQHHASCTGRLFGDAMFEFPDAVLIGTSTKEMRNGRPFFRQRMNPGRDHLIGSDEWLILIARAPDIAHRPGPTSATTTSFIAPQARRFSCDRVLILGWNGNIFSVLQEYDAFLHPGSEIVVVGLHPPEKVHALLEEKLPTRLANATVSYLQVDYTSSTRLEKLLGGAQRFDTCILLADQSSGERDPDARTIVTILLLQDYQARHPDRVLKQIVAEVLSVANSELLQRHSGVDTIISPRLISMLLAQVSQQLMLERVYVELMNAHANEIYLKPAERYARNLATCTFADVMRGAANLGELAIGVKFRVPTGADVVNHGIRINPPREERLSLDPQDAVIVISFADLPAPDFSEKPSP